MTHHTFYLPKTWDAWKKEFRRAFEVLKLNQKAILEIAADAKATSVAFVFICIAQLCSALEHLIFAERVFYVVVYRPSIIEVIGIAIVAVIFSVAFMGLVYLVAKHIFGGKGTFVQFFRAAGYAWLWGFIGILTGFIVFFFIWALVMLYFIIKNVFKIDEASSIGVLAVSVVAVAVIVGLLSMLSVGGMMMMF